MTSSARLCQYADRVQRRLAFRIARALHAAAMVFADVPPVDLLTTRCVDMYRWLEASHMRGGPVPL